MSSSWYFTRHGNSCGPVSGDELMALARKGSLGPDDLVWREGMADWAPASTIGLTGKSFPSKPSRSSPPPLPATSGRTSGTNPLGNAENRGRKRTRQNSPDHFGKRLVIILGLFVFVLSLVGTLIWFSPRLRQHLGQRRAPGNRSGERNRVEPAFRSRVPISDVPGTTVDRDAMLPEPSDDFSSGPASSPADIPVEKQPTVDSPRPAPPSPSDPPNTVPAATSPPSEKSPTPIAVSPNVPPPAPSVPSASGAKQVYYQSLEILRMPQFQFSGLSHAQKLHYRIISRLDVSPGEADRRSVVQFVERTRLIDADETSRAALSAALERLRSQQYSYLVGPLGEITELRGPKDLERVSPVEALGGKGFAMTSVIDLDGWREVAEWTFLRPDPGGLQRGHWTRQMTHDWGALGSWSGTTEFRQLSGANEIARLGFQRKLAYAPPETKAERPSPLTITASHFTANVSDGELEWDTREDRVAVARERFEVTGTVATEVLGQAVEMQLSERQLIEVRVTREPPPDMN